MKPRADIDSIVADLRAGCEALRAELTADYTRPISQRGEHAMARVETFIAIAIRVLRTMNPSKLRDAAMTEEIKARITGNGVLEDNDG